MREGRVRASAQRVPLKVSLLHNLHLQKEFKGKDLLQSCALPSPKFFKDGLSRVLSGIKASRI